MFSTVGIILEAGSMSWLYNYNTIVSNYVWALNKQKAYNGSSRWTLYESSVSVRYFMKVLYEPFCDFENKLSCVAYLEETIKLLTVQREHCDSTKNTTGHI